MVCTGAACGPDARHGTLTARMACAAVIVAGLGGLWSPAARAQQPAPWPSPPHTATAPTAAAQTATAGPPPAPAQAAPAAQPARPWLDARRARYALATPDRSVESKEEQAWSALGLHQRYRFDLDKMGLELEEAKLQTLGRFTGQPLIGGLRTDRGTDPRAIAGSSAMLWAGDAWQMAADAPDGVGLRVANDVPLGRGVSLRPRLDMMVGSYGQMVGGMGGGVSLHLDF